MARQAGLIKRNVTAAFAALTDRTSRDRFLQLYWSTLNFKTVCVQTRNESGKLQFNRIMTNTHILTPLFIISSYVISTLHNTTVFAKTCSIRLAIHPRQMFWIAPPKIQFCPQFFSHLLNKGKTVDHEYLDK